MNIKLLDYNAIVRDGSTEFINSLNASANLILDINAQSSNLITKEEKEWVIGLKNWLNNQDTQSDVNQIVWAYNSIRANLKTIEGRFREDEFFQPYIDDLTRVWRQAFTNPTSLSEEDKKNLAQYFWMSEYNALKNGNIKTVSMPDTKFNFQELSLGASLLDLDGQNPELLTNMGVIFYCKEIRKILWENRPENSSLKRNIKIFKDFRLDPIYSSEFKTGDYVYSQIEMIVKSVPEYLQNNVQVSELEETIGKNITDQFFDFVYDYSYKNNPLEAAKYRLLARDLMPLDEADRAQKESSLVRIVELYQSSSSTRYSPCLCLMLIDKFVMNILNNGSQNREIELIPFAMEFSKMLGNSYTNNLRSDMLACFNTKSQEFLQLDFTAMMGCDWDDMRIHFALKHINHSIISQKAIEEKAKLEETIGQLGQNGLDNQINDKNDKRALKI